MSKELINGIIKHFPDVKANLEAHDKAKKLLNKFKRKLKTKQNHYHFLSELISENATGTKLSRAVKSLFKEVGFIKVVHFESERINPKREDVQAWYSSNEVFIIEVKGISSSAPTHYGSLKVLLYKNDNQKKYPDKIVYGLGIFNHSNAIPPDKRKDLINDNEKNTDAVNLGIGYITTMQLVIGYFLFKTGKISIEEFTTTLKQKGEIIFSNGGQILRQIGLR